MLTAYQIFLIFTLQSIAAAKNYDVSKNCLDGTGNNFIYISDDYGEDSYGTVTAKFQNNNVNCSIQLGRTFFPLVIIVKSLQVRDGCQDVLTVINDQDHTLQPFCNNITDGSSNPRLTTRSGTKINFITGGGRAANTSFEILYNTFQFDFFCNDFKCSIGACIAKALQCDGYNNCGDWSDEKNCDNWPQFCRNDRVKVIQIPSLEINPRKTSGFVRASHYNSDSKCSIVLVPNSKDRLMLAVRKIDLRDIYSDMISVTYYESSMAFELTRTFSNYVNDDYGKYFINSMSNITISFYFGRKSSYSYSGFDFLFTSFQYGSDCSSSSGLFVCRNGHCISNLWTCDGYNQCGDGSDEEYCDSTNSYYIGYVFLVLILVILLVGIAYCRQQHRSTPTVHEMPNPVTFTSQADDDQVTDIERRFALQITTTRSERQNAQASQSANDIPPKYHEVCTPPPDYNQVDGMTNAGFKFTR